MRSSKLEPFGTVRELTHKAGSVHDDLIVTDHTRKGT